jgi:hypothetical protein
MIHLLLMIIIASFAIGLFIDLFGMKNVDARSNYWIRYLYFLVSIDILTSAGCLFGTVMLPWLIPDFSHKPAAACFLGIMAVIAIRNALKASAQIRRISDFRKQTHESEKFITDYANKH